jgi:hypothetical protein
VKSDFDEIVGAEPTGGDRERLRQMHDLLVLAGPPPELTPGLQAGPTLGMTLSRPRRRVRPMLLLAAALMIAAVFVGYSVGSSSSAPRPVETLGMRGTAVTPHAFASLKIFSKQAGNWPMTLTVADLPKLPRHAYYEVYLVRNGKPYLSCGVFRVAGGTKPVSVNLNAPYVFRPGDSWVVTRELPGQDGPGQTVLKPARARL